MIKIIYSLIFLAVIVVSIFVVKTFRNAERNELTLRSRKLWSDHVWWTREHIISYFTQSSNVQPSLTRLLKNQEDIGSLFKKYGKETQDKVTELLKQHILLADR